MIKIFRFIIKYLAKHVFIISTYIGFCILYSSISLISPYVSGSFIDALIGMRQVSQLVNYCIVFSILTASSIIISFILNQLATRVRIQINYGINNDFLLHMQKTSILYVQQQSTAYTAQKISHDTSLIVDFCLQSIQNIMINILLLIFPLIILISLNIYIALILVILILLYLITYFLFKIPLFKNNYQYKEKESKYFNCLYSQLSHMKFMKANSVNEYFNKILFKANKGLLEVGLHTQRINYLFYSLDKIIMGFAQISLFIFGGVQVIQNKLSIGEFTIIITYFNMLMSAIRFFFGYGKTIQETKVSFDRLEKILNQEEEKQGSDILETIDKIEIKSLNFDFDDKMVFADFSMKFVKGNIYAILGGNGTGKSTLINLLTGIYINESSDKIYYNDKSLTELNLYKLRKDKIGILEQEPILLEESIKDNLSIDKSIDESDPLYIKLTNILGLDKFIEKLPDGINTIINEKSLNISGGEKQKIALLRIMLKDSDVIFMDEPTSALDINSKNVFLKYLDEIKEDKIIIITTHDEVVLDICNQIVRLEHK